MTTPVGSRGRAGDRPAGPLRLGQESADRLGRTDVVRQLDPRRPVATERGPEPEYHPPGLEERHLVVRLHGAAPAERLVEGARA